MKSRRLELWVEEWSSSQSMTTAVVREAKSVNCWFYGLCVYIARGLWMALPEHGLFVLYDDLYVMFCHI